jgi:hypothetical protein
MKQEDDRRDHVSFDARFFEKWAQKQGVVQRPESDVPETVEAVFEYIHHNNHWGATDSVSGPGSGAEQTLQLVQAIPELLRELSVETLLDLPCGDFQWMQSLTLPIKRYLGGDIVSALVELNQYRYGNATRSFHRLDLRHDELPVADIILCRDAWVHLSFRDLNQVLINLKRQKIPYLLATTFPDSDANTDIQTGDWRPLNLCRAPFHFPVPLRLLNEGCTEGNRVYQDKSLGLWRITDLPAQLEWNPD